MDCRNGYRRSGSTSNNDPKSTLASDASTPNTNSAACDDHLTPHDACVRNWASIRSSHITHAVTLLPFVQLGQLLAAHTIKNRRDGRAERLIKISAAYRYPSLAFNRSNSARSS